MHVGVLAVFTTKEDLYWRKAQEDTTEYRITPNCYQI